MSKGFFGGGGYIDSLCKITTTKEKFKSTVSLKTTDQWVRGLIYNIHLFTV